MGINIGKFSVYNPVLVNIVMVALLVLGVFSILRLPREQFSEIPFYWVNITVPYPGVSAEDIEKNITTRIEEQLEGLPNVKQITSITREGISIVQVEFEEGISDAQFERLYQRAQTEFNKAELPDGVLEPVVEDFSSADFLPVVEVILHGNVPYRTIDKHSELLRDRLLDIPGVASIERVGAQEQEIRIAVNRQKAEAIGVSLDEIAGALRSANATIPGGTLITPSREYVVRTIGELTDVEEFERVIVRKLPTGAAISIGQLASVRDTFARSSVDLQYNGNTAISLRISKSTDADAIAIVEAVENTISEYDPLLPEGITINLFNNSTIQIRDSLSVLITNAGVGFILVVLTLFAFLGLRNSFVTALGIPLTFALTFIFMEWYGESLNGNSLFALVLILGLIVDHAIIIVENSYRYRQQGLNGELAAIEGTNEVVNPVISATLTTIAAFLPLMLVPGVIGKFLRVIPLVASFALFASMLEAFFFLPSHFAHWGAPPKQKSGKGIFGRLTARFAKILDRVYEQKILFGVGSLIAVILVLSLTVFIRQDLFQGDEYSWFYIDLELAPSAPRSKTTDVVSRYQAQILPMVGKGEVTAISTAIGFSEQENEFIRQNNVAQIQVDLAKQGNRSRSIEQIMAAIREKTDTIPGTFSVRFRKVQGGPPVDPPVSFRFFGDSYDTMEILAREYKNMLSEYPGLYNITDDLERGKPELQVYVNSERAAQLGTSVAAVGQYIRGAVDGIPATTFYRTNDEVDVVVSYDPAEQNEVQDITAMQFPTREQNAIPFSSVAQVQQGQSIAAIKRVDGKRQVQISAEATEGTDAPSINQAVLERFQEQYRQEYPGVTLEMGGEFEEFQNILQQIIRLFGIGLFLIYLLLGAQFKSYIQPFLIIFSIPFAFAGVVLYLLISGAPFSSTVMYAGVALAGIAVNDAIVSISFINDRRREGKSLHDAILEGASVRFRPIVLTSFTTMAGLLPMAIGIGGRSPVWGPMAATIIFGLLFSTTSTLIIMPCWYGIFERTALRLKKRFGN